MKLYKIQKSNIDKKGRGLYVPELSIMLVKLLLRNKQKRLKDLTMQNLFTYLI
jgi:hypothetical protein